MNREVSRKHVQLEVDTASGSVMLTSLGREPVSVNSEPAAVPVELFSGDQIEVHGRHSSTEKMQSGCDAMLRISEHVASNPWILPSARLLH